MAKKRANSEGSIVQRTDGRYMARVTLPDGRRAHSTGRRAQRPLRSSYGRKGPLRTACPLQGSASPSARSWKHGYATAPRTRSVSEP